MTSERTSRLSSAVIAWCVFLILAPGPQTLKAQSVSDSSAVQPARVDTVSPSHPNTVPYASDRTVAYHVLATPAYVLHGVTRPVGWAVLYLERNYPDLFEFRLGRRGVLPLFELGGPVGATVGAMLYDNRLFGTRQQVRVEGMIGARNFFEVRGHYKLPRPLGPGTQLRFVGNFFSEPKDRFFVGGMDSNRYTDAARFAREQVDIMGRLSVTPDDALFGGSLEVLYEHVEARPVEGAQPRIDRPGLTTSDLVTPRLGVTLDGTDGRPRTRAGTALTVQLGYTHDLSGDRFRYGRYVAAVHQYLPVFFFPSTRRLALRARVEQVHPVLGGEAVPFYQLPQLGGQRRLRGYLSDRFRDDGSVLFTAEYRYPVWNRLDAAFFVDTGQVFSALDEVAVSEFKTTFGGGFHLLSDNGISARFEVAWSVEGTEVILTVQPSFEPLRR